MSISSVCQCYVIPLSLPGDPRGRRQGGEKGVGDVTSRSHIHILMKCHTCIFMRTYISLSPSCALSAEQRQESREWRILEALIGRGPKKTRNIDENKRFTQFWSSKHICSLSHTHTQRTSAKIHTRWVHTTPIGRRMWGYSTARHCNGLQHTATHGTQSKTKRDTTRRQHTATHCNTLHRTVLNGTQTWGCSSITHYNTLQYTTIHCKHVFQLNATHASTQQSSRQYTFTRAALQHCNAHHTALKSPCNTPQHAALTHCNTQQHTASHKDTLQHTTPQHTSTHLWAPHCHDDVGHCNTLHHTAPHCTTLHHTVTHCNTLQHTATHCIILQHNSTYGTQRNMTTWILHATLTIASCYLHQRVTRHVTTKKRVTPHRCDVTLSYVRHGSTSTLPLQRRKTMKYVPLRTFWHYMYIYIYTYVHIYIYTHIHIHI